MDESVKRHASVMKRDPGAVAEEKRRADAIRPCRMIPSFSEGGLWGAAEGGAEESFAGVGPLKEVFSLD